MIEVDGWALRLWPSVAGVSCCVSFAGRAIMHHFPCLIAVKVIE